MNPATRPSGRASDQLRTVTIERHYTRHAEGSVLVSFGDTRVLCTASIEDRVPPWLRGKGEGWVTAEYGMLPRATVERTQREAARGGAGGAAGPPAPDVPCDRRPYAASVPRVSLMGCSFSPSRRRCWCP